MSARGEATTRQILTGSPWLVSEPFYDFLQSISFTPDGHGEMAYGYAQALHLLVRFRYTLLPGRLELEYLDTSGGPYDPVFSPTGVNRQQEIGFTLEDGRHPRILHTMSGPATQLYRYILRFDAEPFPVGYQPDAHDLTYFGWQIEGAESG